eukprot:427237-Amphidinium_carterae.1
MLRKLLKVLRPTKLNRDNWAEWRRPVNLVLLLALIHNMLATLWPLAFPSKSHKPQVILSKVHDKETSEGACEKIRMDIRA